MPLTVRVLTPQRALPDQEADFVLLPGADGQLGILPGHAPLAALLTDGAVRISRRNQADSRFVVRGGMAQVENNTVTILAEDLCEADCVSEADLVKRLQALDAATYADGVALAQAKAEAHWLVTQLRCAGKTVPDLKQVG